METNKDLAQKAQMSAEKMEALTEQMNDIAIKTERETVSMRIVTIVTLFFLPGTFVSVSNVGPYLFSATLMSDGCRLLWAPVCSNSAAARN